VALGMIAVYMVHCWGDLGLGSWTGMFLLVPLSCITAKVATASRQGVVQ
jgi:hypothetical protein